MEEKIKKIGLFIDGTFFLKVNSYYRYHHERKSTINFNGLAEFLRDVIARLLKLTGFAGAIRQVSWKKNTLMSPTV
jgi:hypothetical protein